MDHPLTDFMADPERRARLVAAADRAMEEKIAENFKWALPDVVGDECTKFIKEHIAPEVAKHLLQQRSVILSAAIAAADEIGEKLAKSLVDKAAENLAKSWDLKKIVDGLFS